MSLLVKICGLREKRHVDAAIAAGADALGFVFAKSVRQISAESAIAACADVPAHVRRVAVMQHPDNTEWQHVLGVFSPDVLQTDAEDFRTLRVPGAMEQWPVYREGGTPPDSQSMYVYEGSKSGQGETVDWSHAANIAAGGNMILAGGLAAQNIARAIHTVLPGGVDVSSGVESAPGEKDSEMIEEFIAAARAAENIE